jgi:hypothetical protein
MLVSPGRSTSDAENRNLQKMNLLLILQSLLYPRTPVRDHPTKGGVQILAHFDRLEGSVARSRLRDKIHVVYLRLSRRMWLTPIANRGVPEA